MTYTYAVLDVPPAVYTKVRELLDAAGYQHMFNEKPTGEVIDMHGIALRSLGEPAAMALTYAPPASVTLPMTVAELVAALDQVTNKSAWVVVDGQGACRSVVQELGANEPFIVVSEKRG